MPIAGVIRRSAELPVVQSFNDEIADLSCRTQLLHARRYGRLQYYLQVTRFPPVLLPKQEETQSPSDGTRRAQRVFPILMRERIGALCRKGKMDARFR